MKHFIKNVEIAPENILGIGISCDFNAGADQNKVTTDSLILPREGYNLVMNHIENVGLFEGIPYDIEFYQGKRLSYFIDLTEGLKIKNTKVECNIKVRNQHDHFFDKAESLVFGVVHNKTPFNGFKLKYQVMPKDAVGQGISCTIGIYMITVSLAEQTAKLATTAKETSTILSYLPYASQGKALEASLQLAIQIAFVGVLAYQLVELSKRLIELMLPPVKQINACSVYELINKSCEYLGYKFKSSWLSTEYKDMAIVPVPLNSTDKKWYELLQKDIVKPYNYVYPSSSDSTPTLGSLLSTMAIFCNGKIKVTNKLVELERWDYWKLQSSASIKSSLTIQGERTNAYSYDFSRLFKRYYIHYDKDYSDLNTLDNFDNTHAEYSLDLVSVTDKNLTLIKGGSDVSIPFARATAKSKLSWLEKQFKGFLKLIDSKAEAKFDRYGVMMITEPFFSTAKLIMHDGSGKISKTKSNLLYATTLWDKFHYINNPLTYQNIIKENVRVAMSPSQFMQVMDNNFVEIDGLTCEVMKIEYFDEGNYAVISYKEPKNIFKKQITLTKIF